jgi:Tfp pilus assembly protein PilF
MRTRAALRCTGPLLTLACVLGSAGCQLSGQPSAAGNYGTDDAVLTPGYGSQDNSGPFRHVSATGSSIAEGTKKLGNWMADALDVPPRVIPAEDPASLASTPRQLGPAVYVHLAHTAEQQNHSAAAKKYLEKALEVAPDDLPVLIAYARFCDRQGLTDLAAGAYQQAWQKAPTEPLVLNDIGLFYARSGRLEQARHMLQQAVDRQPGNIRYRNNLANVMIATGQIDAAVQLLQAVLPASNAYFNVACLLQEQGMSQEALLQLRRSVELDPNFTPAVEMLARSQTQTYLARLPHPAQSF